MLQSKDGHALWVSSAVLKSIEPLPSEVEGGVIVRDSFGKPTGASTYFDTGGAPSPASFRSPALTRSNSIGGPLRRRTGFCLLIPIRRVPGQRAGPRRPPRAHLQAAPKALRGHCQGRAPPRPDVGPRCRLQPHIARVFPPVGHMSMSGASSQRSLNECSCHAPEEKRNPANSR